MEDPKLAKGLVKREVTRVVSPGTLTDDALLDPRESNYLAAVALSSRQTPSAASSNGTRNVPADSDGCAGLAWAELSTGLFFPAPVPCAALDADRARFAPPECLRPGQRAPGANLPPGPTLPRRPAWAFGLESAVGTLQKHFQTATLEGFGFGESDSPALRA